MAILGGFASLVKRFNTCARGAVAIIFALTLVPLFLSAGIAIDYIRYVAATTQLQSALDAGALAAAAAKNLSTSGRVNAAEKAYSANLATGVLAGLETATEFQVSGVTVRATARLSLASSFMQLAGLGAMEVAAETEISLPTAPKPRSRSSSTIPVR